MDLQFLYGSLISFFIFLTILLTLIQKGKRAKKKKQKLPPGPWKLPLIGSIHHLIVKSGGGSLPHHILRDLARKHGPLMHLQLGQVSAIVVSSPRMAEEVMKTHDLAFSNRPRVVAFEMITYNYSSIGSSPYGDYWRQMRKICVTELLSAKNVRLLGSIRRDEGSSLVASIRTLSTSGKPINLSHEITSYTSSMLCRAAFGELCRSEQDAFMQLAKEISILGGGFGVAELFPSWKFLPALNGTKFELSRIQNRMDAIFDKIIDEHMEKLRTTSGNANATGQDLIDVLLRVKENDNLQFPISNNNIKAIIFDMFAGGTETSSTTVEWAMSEMMKNPDVMTKAQNEVRQAFKGKMTVDENGLQELNYLKLVIKEILRLHPALSLLVPRECREDCEIDGYNITKKTKVIVNAWAIGRDEEYWSDPESFKPERFEHSSIDFTSNHFEYVPFGSGRRMCPGISFGIANVELPLALLLYHFNWELPPGVTHLDMSETFGITVPRKHNLHLVPSLYDPSLYASS